MFVRLFVCLTIAPLVVPKINIKKWRSQVKLSWEEIPLEQRNGIIQNYKVFYWEEEGPVNGWWKSQLLLP